MSLDTTAANAEAQLGADVSLREVLFAATEPSQLDPTAFAQTSLFALEVALFRLFESWGLTPDLLLGHSIGELTAAHVAGILTLEDACILVGARALLMQALPPTGLMLTVQASEEEMLAVLERAHGASLGAVNGPRSVLVSGDREAVLEVERHFEGRKCSRLRVSHAGPVTRVRSNFVNRIKRLPISVEWV